MNPNPETAKWVLWGYKSIYHTHNHIHEAFYRALRHMGKEVLWLEVTDDISSYDFTGSIFITEHQKLDSLPMRRDCLYLVHNLCGNERPQFHDGGYPVIGWGCYVHANLPGYGPDDMPKLGPESIKLADGAYFTPQGRDSGFQIMWATNLLPHEIEANKPDRILGRESRVINWVGTCNLSHNGSTIAPFVKECEKNGISFRPSGAYTNGHVVTDADAQNLIRESYFAPAIGNELQRRVDYVPCRLFKNVSYGMPGITNIAYGLNLFDGTICYERDSARLFYEAQRYMERVSVKALHAQMDVVAQSHTYINRIQEMITACKLYWESL